jgi:DNA-binding CsgD family transcriptional regulator
MDSAATLLRQARLAYERRDWADALDLLSRADKLAPLASEDLERLLWSAGMLDRDADLFAACERLFDAQVEAGRDDAAAYWAFFCAFRLLALREEGRATAWLQRAQGLIERHGRECAASGYLLLPAIQKQHMAGDDEGAAELAATALAIGERCSDLDLQTFAKGFLGRALVRQGRIDEGKAKLDEAMLSAIGGELSPIITGLVYCNVIATCRQIYAFDRSREWTDALASWCGAQPQLVQFNGLCRIHRAELLEMNGSWQESLAEARLAANSLVRAIAADTAGGAAYQEAEIHRLRGEYDSAEEFYRTANRHGFEPQPGMALLRLAQGRGEQAAASIKRVLTATGDTLRRTRLLPAFVEIMIATGAIEDARAGCKELEESAARFATDILVALASQARGEVEWVEGEPNAALACFRKAFATWRRLGAPFIEARLRLKLGQICRALGDEDGAQMEFEAARAAFAELGAAPDLDRAETLLSRPHPRASKGLTSRELEVLALVAAGDTNRSIAARLGLSEKTIDRHVSNLFDKLAVSSRAAATALAIRNNLV